MATASSTLNRQQLIDWYTRNRARSKALFDLVSDEAYYARPIALRHPLVFYEGHLPGFSFNTLVKKGLGRPSIDASLESLFARGIDPHESKAETPPDDRGGWPLRAEVRAFAEEADARVLAALENEDLERPGHPLLDRAEAAFAILEHEAMHQETLLYMWHRLPFEQKRKPGGYTPAVEGAAPKPEWIDIPAGRATLGIDAGAQPFSWDNERPARTVDVPAFGIARHDVTNADFLEFVEAGGYTKAGLWRPEDRPWIKGDAVAHPLFWERHDGQWYWRGMFDLIPLPLSWPAYVSWAEAFAYARWRGLRLPSESEFQRAAYGTPGACSPRSTMVPPAASTSRAASSGAIAWSTCRPTFCGPAPACSGSSSSPNDESLPAAPMKTIPSFRNTCSTPNASSAPRSGATSFAVSRQAPSPARSNT